MIGVDEVGRGAWAGPLLVAAVRLSSTIEGLRDSKKLSPKRREELSKLIMSSADVGFGWVSPQQIDAIGLSAALRLATKSALVTLSPDIDEEIIIDGNINFAPEYRGSHTVVRADDTFPCVSAASIVAKVARDTYMVKLNLEIPGYGFEKHVGYGTALHTMRLQEHGLSAEHRQSFKLPY